MPILILAYIFNYLDRNNVGFAGLTMNQAIGLTATQLGFGAGVFFLAVLPPRSSEQHRALPRGCARVAVAHHDLVGARVGGNRVCGGSLAASMRSVCSWARLKRVSSRAWRSTSEPGSRRSTGPA